MDQSQTLTGSLTATDQALTTVTVEVLCRRTADHFGG